MECLYGFLSNISRDLVCGAVNQLRYPCCFNNFVEELAKEEDNLIATRNSVKDRSAHAKKQTRKTAEVVDKWLENAEIDVDNVNNLLNEARTKNSCCFGHCPNWIWRYNLGKKLANKKKELENFIKEGGQYIQLERVATLPSGIDLSSEKYLSFGSRQKAYEEIMEAVKDDEVGMIGLYGMGGCGKTTLAMEVLKKAEAEHLFDKVLFVPVSSTVEVQSIQDKIASSLQFTFPENEERERAKRLYMRLTQENKILVILDDVWEKLDFGAIGIPSTEHHKGCKVLITTRSEDVCTSNDCQKKIQLQILTNEDAWALFQKQAHISDGISHTLLIHLARQISDECKGLPVAIAAVASTLKGKDKVIWRDALNKLKSSNRVNIEKGLPDPYKCLELSYHYLYHEEAKSLFLLCSVFPEDYEIPVELLTRFAIGLGVVGEVYSYEDARVAVTAAKIKLVNSCLLLDAGRGQLVKMHDLVRNVAHLIAKNENKGIKCEVEKDVMTLEQNSIRYLWCKKLPNDLDCSNLEFLCITTEVEVLDEIFTRMGKLRVLFLDNKGEDRLPLSTMSFKTLTNLRCLILLRWKLSDISFVRYMKNLESLSLNGCSLPSFLDLQKDDIVTQLTKLKLLVLHECEMERNIIEVIGRIPQLEELCIVGSDGNTIEFLKSFSVPQTLQRYTITLGITSQRWGFLTPPERTLWLTCFDISNEAIMGLAKKAKNLYMVNIKGGAKNIIPNIFQLERGGMPELNKLRIQISKEIECLVDSSNHTSEVVGSLFSSLKSLELRDCPKLRSLLTQAITPNPVRYTTFQNLQHVQIRSLPQLKYVFSANTVGGLPQLERLHIERCSKLEQIVEDIIPSVANELEMIEENSSTPSAPLVNHSPGSFTLSKLTSLGIYSCPKLGSLFPASTAKTLISLEELSIKYCHGLKHLLICERAHNNEKQNSVEDDHDLHSVISMFLSLKSLVIEECDLLQHIFPVFPVGGQNNIKHNSFTLQLTTLQIIGCAKLEVIFLVSVLRCLPELERLEIRQCNELKHIMEEDQNHRIQRELKPCFPKLTVVIVQQCHKLKRLFSASASDDLPNLGVLVINGANELEEPIECEHREDEEIGKAKVELPKLKLLILMHLPHLRQGIELSVVKHRIINNCPKLSLTSTTTLQELYENFPDSDFAKLGVPTWKLKNLINEIKKSNEVSKRGGTSEIPSSQINEELEKESVGKFHGSEVHDTAATSTNLELNGRSSLSPLDICQHETNIELEWDPMPENNSPLQMNQEDPTTSKSEQPSSQDNDKNQSILRNIAGTVHEHKQNESGALDFDSNKFLALEREGKRIKTSSTGVEVISLGGVVKQDDKLNEGKTDSVVTRTRLEAYKQFVDLDDAQIALLEEAITAYPHLWNACQKFSERFQAWMLKTLADMLLFLQNESGHTVTPQREKEFHKLCDEAVELGFDRTWVDEMRQSVVATDPKLEKNRAQGSINELFKRSTGADMVPYSQVVEQGDGPNEHRIGTSQCQK